MYNKNNTCKSLPTLSLAETQKQKETRVSITAEVDAIGHGNSSKLKSIATE